RSSILLSPEAEVRAEVLKSWRRTYANENDIPAFIVFSDRSLVDLANRNPGSLSELTDVHGFGAKKTEILGPAILNCLKGC
ncbi:MAG: HRDC domain-containing protein, partial [Bdellovibrionota bacterium]